jgi:hypothetical protein
LPIIIYQGPGGWPSGTELRLMIGGSEKVQKAIEPLLPRIWQRYVSLAEIEQMPGNALVRRTLTVMRAALQ